MHVRSIVDMQAGDEALCSYLSDEHLYYAPWAERARLLREAFHFEALEPSARRIAEAEIHKGHTLSPPLRQQSLSTIAAVRRALSPPDSMLADSVDTAELGHATERLVQLVHTELQPVLHAFHWIVLDAHAVLLAAARADGGVDEPRLAAQSALHLIAACEFLLPLGTLHLATLYAAHGGALCRVLRDGSLESTEQVLEVASTVVRSFSAAHRIRCCCLGDRHPLSVSTGRAVQRAHETCSRLRTAEK